jgi:hypothetical protein
MWVRTSTFAISIGSRSSLATEQILDTEVEFLETAPMVLRSRFLSFSATVMVAGTLVLCPADAQKQEPTQYRVLLELSGVRGGNLVVPISAGPATFNRLFASGMAHALVADQLAADLVHISRSAHEIEPFPATRWEVARDGRTYMVHLRRGVCFSDRRPFTGEDVVFTVNALADTRIGSTLADQLRVDDKFPSVSWVDAYTVRITLPRSVGIGLRAFDSMPILPRNKLVKSDADVNALTTRLVQSLDPSVRLKAFAQMQEIRAIPMPEIPTVALNILSGWKNTVVGNIRPSILVPYLLWHTAEPTQRAVAGQTT